MKSWRSSFRRATACASALIFAGAVAVACSSSPNDAGGTPSSGEGGVDAPITIGPGAGEGGPALGDAAPPTTGLDATSPDAAQDDSALPPPPDLAPAPTLSVIKPTQAIVGTNGPTIVCTGMGFVSRSVVQVNGVPLKSSFVSGTELRATIPNANMATVATLHVTVGTAPPGGGGSAEVPFEVVNPSPAIASLKPTSTLLGSPDTLLTVAGSSFVPGATVSFNGTTLATTVSDPKTVTATIPAAALASSGIYPVTVTNPAPGGGASTSIAFIVSNPSVTVSTVTPSTLLVKGPAATIALVGTGFVAASAVSFNGAAIPTTYASSTQLGATVPASALLNAGAFPVAVTNPAPGGGVSSPVTVNVVYPSVTASSVSPTSVVLGSPPPTITVTGTGFLAGATTIALDGAASLTTVIDATHAQAALTTAQMGSAHTFQLTVSNPAPGGGTSAPLSFGVNDPVPVASAVSPSSVVVGAGATTVTIAGSGFVPASAVLVGSTALPTTYVSAAALTAVLPAADLASTGTLSIYVSNPAPGGGKSSPALSFGVNNPAPTATSVAPSFATVGAPDTPINVSGSAFVPSSTVMLGSTPLATTYVNAGSLNAVLPAADLASAASLSLSVSTPAPGGGTSGALGFTVDNPGPAITQISPSSVTVPAGDTLVTVSGSGFVSGVSAIHLGGTPLSTAFNGGSLFATVPAAQLASATTLSITVANPPPGGGTSNVAYLTATDPAPALTSVSPTTIYALSGATPITLSGSGFVAASVVRVNGASIPITAQSGTSLTATIPAAMLAAPGTLTVNVSSPAPGGGTSGSATINVVCDVSNASVVLSSLSTPTTLGLNFSGAPTAYRITTSLYNDACPSADDTTGVEPYRAYVVVNDTASAATLSAWAVCGATDDGFLTFYSRSTVPTTQAQLEACTGFVAEGASGAGAHQSPQPGTSSYCPGLTKGNGGGYAIAACEKAVVLIQPYSTTGTTYTPPTTLTIELQ